MDKSVTEISWWSDSEEQLELFIKDYEKKFEDNYKETKKFLKNSIKLFEALFDIQQEFFKNHFFGIIDPYYGFQDYERVILHCYLKTISLLFSAHKLTLNGNYGSANILLRQIFEFLLIGKYASIIKNNELAKNWLNKGQMDVYDKIIRLFKKPSKASFHDYWIISCNYAHATNCSYQGNISFKHNKKETFSTYTFILLFLRCNYHLLSSRFINSRLTYRSEYYGGYKQKNIQLREKAKGIIKIIETLYSQKGKNLIRDYQSAWLFKK